MLRQLLVSIAVSLGNKFDFMINLKTAKMPGPTIPPTMLALATAVIE